MTYPKYSPAYWCTAHIDHASGQWEISFPSLSGCVSAVDIAHGIEAVQASAKEALTLWLEVSLEHGDDVALEGAAPKPFLPNQHVFAVTTENVAAKNS